MKVKDNCEIKRTMAHLHLAICALADDNHDTAKQHLEACESVIFEYEIDPLNPPAEPTYDVENDRLVLAPGVTEVDEVRHATTREPCLLPPDHAGRHRSLDRSWV